MQKELQELQPKLVQTSLETEELIKVIESETEEVEKVKQVVEADEAVANAAAMESKAIKVGRARFNSLNSDNWKYFLWFKNAAVV